MLTFPVKQKEERADLTCRLPVLIPPHLFMDPCHENKNPRLQPQAGTTLRFHGPAGSASAAEPEAIFDIVVHDPPTDGVKESGHQFDPINLIWDRFRCVRLAAQIMLPVSVRKLT